MLIRLRSNFFIKSKAKVFLKCHAIASNWDQILVQKPCKTSKNIPKSKFVSIVSIAKNDFEPLSQISCLVPNSKDFLQMATSPKS